MLLEAIFRVKEAYKTMDPEMNTSPLDITVSFDGTWQKRGHTSMCGVAAVRDVYTGLVVDCYSVKVLP